MNFFARLSLAHAILAAAPFINIIQDAKNTNDQISYERAWSLLEVDRKPAEAMKQFEAVFAAADTTKTTRAKCLVGIARCAEMSGNKSLAAEKYREVLEKYSDVSTAAQEAAARLSTTSTARWISGIQQLSSGQFLDLDTGGIYAEKETPAGSKAEIGFIASGRIDLLVETDDGRAMAACVPWLSDAPWRRLTTDLGRASWIQIVDDPPRPVVRFVTRIAGGGEILPQPANLCCVGRKGTIEVWFDNNPQYKSYRVERREGAHGSFAPAGSINNPPFIDINVHDGKRYGYRLTGLASVGDEGIAGVVQGTTRSAGVTVRTFELKRDKHMIDLLAGEHVIEGGDLTLDQLFGSGDKAAFLDSKRMLVPAAPFDHFRSPYGIKRDPAVHIYPYIEASDAFLVRIDGGGIARCTWENHFAEQRDGEVSLRAVIYPDADAFPPGPKLTIRRDGNRNIISVEAPAGATVDTVAARALIGGEELTTMLPVKDGAASGAASKEDIYEYRASYVDVHGRRSPETVIIDNRLAAKAREGEFEFHYQQGYSIERHSIVPNGEADVVFSSCAGGITCVTLASAGGIINYNEPFRKKDLMGVRATTLFDALRSANPALIKFTEEANADSREGPSDVFLLRTRNGGFAKLVIAERENDAPGGWTKLNVKVKYCYNPAAPIFTEGVSGADGATLEIAGTKFANIVLDKPKGR
ncbi:MAG: hypothetical protein HY286_14150 [Planctomycetes bacterium]|nr:hypothetical protein [Planctomycetota bacterium]